MGTIAPSGRLIVGISGSSGPIFGVRLLEIARDRLPGIELHLVISAGGRRTIELELDRDPAEVAALAHVVHDEREVGAAIASGSFRTLGMVVAPCSIRTLSAVANSANDTLIPRAADVCLKERRPLVLMVRETPLHHGHLDLMLRATRSGAIVAPPVPAFYHRPKSLLEVVDHSVVKALDLVGLPLEGVVERWAGPPAQEAR